MVRTGVVVEKMKKSLPVVVVSEASLLGRSSKLVVVAVVAVVGALGVVVVVVVAVVVV